MQKLIEIFKEHVPIVEGGSQFNRYRALFKVEKRRKPKKVTLKALRRYVRHLNRKYPKAGFCLRRMTYRRKVLHVLTKKNPDANGGVVPIYFDLRRQRFFISREDLERQPRLANFVIMTVLGALGVSQSKYIKIVGSNHG